MAANNNPIFTGTPNIGKVKIGTTSAQVKSDGTSAGTGTDLMYCAYKTGTNGSFITSVRFNTVATAVTNSVATVLRVYLTTVTVTSGAVVAGATTAADTQLLAEVGVEVQSSANATVGTNFREVPIMKAIPTGYGILVSQHTAQNTNQNWQATCFAGDY